MFAKHEADRPAMQIINVYLFKQKNSFYYYLSQIKNELIVSLILRMFIIYK